MTPEQQNKMIASLSEYTKPELGDLAVKLQDTIDVHVSEQRHRQAAVDQMSKQNDALVAENERLEDLTKGIQQVDNDEVVRLRAKVEELDKINTGLQRSIIKLSE